MTNTAQREVKSLETSFGTKYTVKAWLNKAESRTLFQFLAKHSSVDDGGIVTLALRDVATMLDYYDVLVGLYVASIGESTDVKATFDVLRDEDADEIQAVVLEMYQSAQKKTKSLPTNTGTTSTPDKESSQKN